MAVGSFIFLVQRIGANIPLVILVSRFGDNIGGSNRSFQRSPFNPSEDYVPLRSNVVLLEKKASHGFPKIT
jgi:hypothetical protein